jgi:eukaryotic-like serine/threonine-protein kinase
MSTPKRSAAPAAAAFHGTPRFEVRRILGEGGMGIVYEAFDHDRQMPVAIKTLRWVDAQSIFALKTEFRVRADLEHRNLVRLGELHHEEGYWFFTMELVKGVDFLEWVRPTEITDDTPLYNERRLRAALRQLATGLDALHHAGMIHRDIKPSNVMITADGRVVLLDFGLIADVRAQLSDSSVVGTAAYMSPEQAMSKPPGPASDWYSVGVMLYQALTARLPIDGAPLEIMMRKQHRRPPRRVAGAPEDLSQLCVALLATDPASRPTSAHVLRMLAARGEERQVETPFVGRLNELGVLERALADVTGGATIAISIEGESGIGKTKLVRHFVERASELDTPPLVLSGRCHERETMPFKGIDGIVDTLARTLNKIDLGDVVLPPASELTALAQTFPVLLRVSSIAREAAPLPPNLLELRARAFRGLRHLLCSLAEVTPLLVTIDDIQWADPDSLVLLTEILHAPGSPRMLLVLTRREEGPPPVLPIPVTRLHLAPLSAIEAHELVERTAPERAAESADLIAGAGGHPMFLRELLRHASLNRGTRLDDAIWARITRMDISARRILELVAIAGRPLPQGMVAEVLDLDPRRAAKWFAVLRSASLARTGGNRAADPIEPYHDRVRMAVQARIAPARRRRYHERLAAMLLAGGYAERDPLTVVEHLEAAGRREQAAALARRSVRRTVDQLAFEQVAALCSAALRLADEEMPDDERRAVKVRRAEALALAGRGAEAARDYLDAATGASAEDAFHYRRAAAEQLLVSGHINEGLALLRECMAEIDEQFPESSPGTRRALIANMVWLRVRRTQYRERPPNTGSAQAQLRLDLYRTASLGLSLIDPVPGALCQARALRTAMKLGDRRRTAYALAYHAMYSAAAGERHIAYARSLVAQSRKIAEADRNSFLLGWARCGEGVVEYFAGHFELAVDVLIDAEVQLREHIVGAVPELNHLRLFIMFALRRHGDFDRLRSHYLEYVRDATRRGDRYAITSFRWSANAVWLAADEPARARSELEAVVWSKPEDGLHLQHWFLARARAELALYEDDRDAMRAAREGITVFLSTPLAHVEVVRADTSLELARFAIVERDLPTARRAIVRLRRERAPYLRAMCMLVEAAADELEGRHDEARAHLADATALCEASGMAVISALARRRTGELMGGDFGARISADADAVLRRHGIVEPTKFARAFATWPTAP